MKVVLTEVVWGLRDPIRIAGRAHVKIIRIIVRIVVKLRPFVILRVLVSARLAPRR